MKYTTRNKSIPLRALGLGVCLALFLGLVAAASLPADALAGGSQAEQALDKAVNAVKNTADDVIHPKKHNGDLSINDPEWEWGYPLYTLLIRFVGIFVVLGILQIIMQLSGRFFVGYEAKKKAEAQAAK